MTSAAERMAVGLAPARAARHIRVGERIHVVGAAGAGASAAAILAARAGAIVTACDAGGPSPYTLALDALGIHVAPEHAASHVTAIPHPDRLAVTKALTAIDPHSPELEAARGAGIPVEPWQQVVADAAVGRRQVGVAGTHGKSTTAGWLVHVLVAAGLDPSAFVGALLAADDGGGAPSTARFGAGTAFVIEADEYAGNFDAYHPDVAILTSAEWDHPDVFRDAADVGAAFERWVRRAPAGATLVANVGDPGVASIAAALTDWSGSVVAYALVGDADADAGFDRHARAGLDAHARAVADRFTTAAGRATAILGRVIATERSGTTVEIFGLDDDPGSTRTSLATAGRHNAANALAVAGAAAVLGVPARDIATGLASFRGVGRRLERKGEAAGVVVYDDYGHHPTAVRATLEAVRQREPGRPVWAVYEPLTYHRTAAMLDAFADALAGADAVAVADIWAGRDPDTTITSAAALAEAVSERAPGMAVLAPGSVEATADALAGVVRAGDVVLVMGGGHSYRIGERLLERLEAT